MQGPVVDIVQLGLLVLFLWIQQRSRSNSYIRFWVVGWIAVFLSYVIWSVPRVPAQWLNLQSTLDFDFMLLGALAFLVSLLPRWEGPRQRMYGAIAIGVANVLIIDAQEFGSMPKLLLVGMVLAWQGCGVFFVNRQLRGELARTRRLILTLCGVYGVATIAYVVRTPARELDNWTVAQVLLCTAVLYWHWGKKRSLARWVGTAGFVLWAAFYFADVVLTDTSSAQMLLNQLWSIPKYVVAATMILKIFEDARDEKAKLAEEFRELAEDFRLIFEMHPHPMWICDGEGGRFLEANSATSKVYGYSIEELREMRMAELDAPPDAELDAKMEEMETEQGVAEGMRLRHRHKAGHVVWVNLEEREIQYLGKRAQFVIVHDITERLKLHRELSHRAQHDMLTGLPNRQLFADRLELSMRACERDERKAAILTIDVDHFKLINDAYGHLVGDECLQAVAGRLKSKIRKVDTIARTGGEEFMAVVGGLSCAHDAEKVAASLLRVFELPLELSIGKLGVKVSIGVAVFPDDGVDVVELRRLSDEALYAAKRAGRNRVAYAYDMAAPLRRVV